MQMNLFELFLRNKKMGTTILSTTSRTKQQTDFDVHHQRAVEIKAALSAVKELEESQELPKKKAGQKVYYFERVQRYKKLAEDTNVNFLLKLKRLAPNGYCQINTLPVEAASLLELNINNRKMRTSVVKYYQTEMENGNWSDNGDPIRISKNGRLLNGQHRLTAAVIADRPITFRYLIDLEEDAYKFMDNGLARSASDNLGIKAEHSATLKYLYAFTRPSLYDGMNRVGISQIQEMMTNEVMELIEEIPRTKRHRVSCASVKAVTIAAILMGKPKEVIFKNYQHIMSINDVSSAKEIAFNAWLTKLTGAKGFNLSYAFSVTTLIPAFLKFYCEKDFQKFRLREVEAKTLMKELMSFMFDYYRCKAHRVAF
jgi:hypothetical protein